MIMPKRYGILYSGSKNKICERIIDILPPADNFYDLFAGGCAVTHRALLSGKYNNVIANDINDMPLLFKDAIQGKYKDEDRWITREMFFDNLDNPYISSCWSFGGNMTSYIYSREITPYKKALWYAVMFGEWNDFEKLMPETLDRCKTALMNVTDKRERRTKLQNELSKYIKELDSLGDYSWKQHTLYKQIKTDKGGIQRSCLNSCTRLQQLQSLQSLERLQQHLTILKSSYDEVVIKPNSVIYCDIPYINTANAYNVKFDYEKFYSWCENQSSPVFISEYNMPEDRFKCIKTIQVGRKCSSTKFDICDEKVFVPNHQYQDFLTYKNKNNLLCR